MALIHLASKYLAQDLVNSPFPMMQNPVISNTAAKIITQEEIKEILEKKVIKTGRIEDKHETMKNMNVRTKIE
ncbi:ACP S-malonyltransferase, partial [Enterococcus faecalis]